MWRSGARLSVLSAAAAAPVTRRMADTEQENSCSHREGERVGDEFCECLLIVCIKLPV